MPSSSAPSAKIFVRKLEIMRAPLLRESNRPTPRASGNEHPARRCAALLRKRSQSGQPPGIPPENEAKLFQPFFTTKPHGRGTGLGLAIVKRTIEAFGGKVGIGPREGGGTRAVVRLNAVVARTARGALPRAGPLRTGR